ncbi:DUF2397 family protein [Streptomyces sp. NPDC056437]|uniref:DUF2397 family protein n=1 Tax=Streptomyces sp. NPDC056437 TaxID=3345816 RepID=UPI0036A93945
MAAVEDEDLHEALRKLVQWELLDVVHSHAENYRTAEEYERRNLQYSLTRRGEAALAGARHAAADGSASLLAGSDNSPEIEELADGLAGRRVGPVSRAGCHACAPPAMSRETGDLG